MATLTERLPHDGGFLISQGNGDISRDVVTLARHSEIYASGTVLGQVTVGLRHTHYDNAASDGTQAAKAVLLYDVDARAADAQGVVIARMATVNKAELVFRADQNDAAKAAACADLATQTIIAR